MGLAMAQHRKAPEPNDSVGDQKFLCNVASPPKFRYLERHLSCSLCLVRRVVPPSLIHELFANAFALLSFNFRVIGYSRFREKEKSRCTCGRLLRQETSVFPESRASMLPIPRVPEYCRKPIPDFEPRALFVVTRNCRGRPVSPVARVAVVWDRGGV